MSLRLILQIIRFGSVGIMVSAIHYLIAVLMISFGVWPLWANFFAFIFALHLSFFGHFYWTFAHVQAFRLSTAMRYLAVAVFGFCVNEGLFYSLLHWTQIGPQWCLLWVLLIVAAITFQLSRFWVFKCARLHPI